MIEIKADCCVQHLACPQQQQHPINADMSAHRRPHLWARIAGTIAILFGILTIKEGGAVLLGDDEAVRAAGHYVPFVLWFNTVAGLAYILAGLGVWLLRRWAVGLSFVIAASSFAVLFALGVHIAVGETYELRTLIAMTMRSAVWIAIAVIAGVKFERQAGFDQHHTRLAHKGEVFDP